MSSNRNELQEQELSAGSEELSDEDLANVAGGCRILADTLPQEAGSGIRARILSPDEEYRGLFPVGELRILSPDVEKRLV